MIKHLPLISIFELTNIITNIIKLGYFPPKWKTAAVIPILKPGKDPTKADSFRPIALLSVLGKVAEKIILTVPSCGHNKFNYPRATWLPTQSIDITPTFKSGGSDKNGFHEAKIDRCGFPRHTKSF
ncbi:putative RNA-directed DNA polymerase from transposon X-element [Trichonephila clavipes]|nr:putative RNA-directed DNA polymerase from transposon X-element [Trichonephila clavipes]